jgi:hypothetical protein
MLLLLLVRLLLLHLHMLLLLRLPGTPQGRWLLPTRPTW